MKKKKFQISLKTWKRAENTEEGEDVFLEDVDGMKCCLGFYLRSCGISQRDILHQQEPDDLPSKLPQQTRWLVDETAKNSDDGFELMKVNDDKNLTPAARKKKIQKLFAKHDVEVEFVP